MKASGLAWAARMPASWTTPPIGAVFEVQLGKMLSPVAAAGGEPRPYLRNLNIQWDRISLHDIAEMHFDAADRLRYALRRGDLLVCEGGEVGRAAIWRDELAECYYQKALHRVRPWRADSTRFLMYALMAAASLGVFENEGNTSTIVHLTAEKLRSHRFPWPPLSEQRAIVDHLDAETARVDQLVDGYRRIRDVLVEKRMAITVGAVEGQLVSADRRPSRLTYLRTIPEHWAEVRLNLLAKLGSGHTPSREHPEWWVDTTFPWITTGEVWQLRDDRVEYVSETRENVSELGVANSAAELHPAGTVFLSRTASAGFSGIMARDMATSQDFVTWTCGPRIRPRFLLLCLRAMRGDLLGRLAMGSTHQTIYFPDIQSIRVPLPPVDEQDQIVEWVWTRLQAIDAAADAIQRQVSLLRERRQAVITAAVTGQFEIPGVAA